MKKFITVMVCMIFVLTVSFAVVTLARSNLQIAFDTADSFVAMNENPRISDVVYLELVFNVGTFEFVPEIADIVSGYVAGLRAVYIDTSYENIPRSDAIWHSSNESVFVIEGDGIIRTTGVGTASVIVEYGGVTTEKEIIVVQGFVENISFWPEQITLIRDEAGEGGNLAPQVYVIAYTSGGGVHDITRAPFLSFLSTDNSIVVPQDIQSDFSGRDGYSESLMEGFSEGNDWNLGEASIVVYIERPLTRMGALTASLSVRSISADSVERIEIVHASDENVVLLGFADSISAYAIFGDGTMMNITSKALWETDNSDVLQVIGGWITSYNTGYVVVTATYLGVSGSIILSVEEQVNYAYRFIQ
jgi:hypothetical protein